MKLQKKDVVFPIAVLSVIAGGLLLIDNIIFSVLLSSLATVTPTELTVFLVMFLVILYLCSFGLIALFFLICKSKVITQLKTFIVIALSVSSTVVGSYLTIWTLNGGNQSALATAVFLIGLVIMGLSIFWINHKEKEKQPVKQEDEEE